MKCVQCRVDRKVCSLSHSGLDHDTSADPLGGTPSPSKEPAKSKSKASFKRKASSSPESESPPHSKMKNSSNPNYSTSSEPKTFGSSKHQSSSSSNYNPSALSKLKSTASSKAKKGEPSASNKSFPNSLPETTLSAHLDFEDVRSQVRILSHRVTEVEEARVRERAAYGQSLRELSSRMENLERSEKLSKE